MKAKLMSDDGVDVLAEWELEDIDPEFNLMMYVGAMDDGEYPNAVFSTTDPRHHKVAVSLIEKGLIVKTDDHANTDKKDECYRLTPSGREYIAGIKKHNV